MEQILELGAVAREKVKNGVDKGADTVKHTVGPFGTNILIQKGTRITNDGATGLKELTLEDEVENLGLSKLKEAVAKSNEKVGDGSTTIAILVQAILERAHRLLGTDKTLGGKMTTAEFLRKIRHEAARVEEKLITMATPITTREELVKSAIVSVEDEELGELIGGTQWDLGKDGFILAEEKPEPGVSIERVSGVKIDNGLGASYVMNNQEKQMLEVENVPTILTSHTIQSLNQLKDVLEQYLNSGRGRKVAIIARAFSQEAINEVGANLQNGIEIYPINAPYTDMREVMLDLASVLGGQFLDSEIYALEDAQVSDMGFAAKIRARRYDAIITGKHDADSEKVQKRITELKDAAAGAASDFEKKQIERRIAQLENGFAVVQVGAESETERKRLFDKVEDAVNAVRAAYQEGTVPGAGLAFKEIAEDMDDTDILKRPLMALHEQIMKNAPEGFEIEAWVRDPKKVLSTALTQAVSVAGDLATVNAVITTKKQKFNAFINKD